MITIDLLDDYDMPTLEFMKLETLFDTGANKSVANFAASMFELVFQDKILKVSDSYISGYGGIVYGKDYLISSINISGLNFKDVIIFVPDTPTTRFKLILAGTLFSKWVYQIDMIHHKLTIYEDDCETSESADLEDKSNESELKESSENVLDENVMDDPVKPLSFANF